MNQTEQTNSFYNAPNVIVENVFSEEEFNFLKNIDLENCPGQHVPHLGYWAYHIQLPESLILKLNKTASDLMNQEMTLKEYQIAIYKNYYLQDKSSQPMLFPHIDAAFDEPRFAIDCLLDCNTDWPLSVECNDNITTLIPKIGDCMTFSGTHQVHWRPKKDFLDDEFVKLIFLHFMPVNAYKISSADSVLIKLKEQKYRDAWNLEPGNSSQRIDELK